MCIRWTARNACVYISDVTDAPPVMRVVSPRMPHAKKIVLHCHQGYEARLNVLVEEFVNDGVVFVGVVGPDCAKVEDLIDELVVGDGSREYHLLTSSHPEQTIEQAVAFAHSLTGDFKGEVQIVEL